MGAKHFWARPCNGSLSLLSWIRFEMNKIVKSISALGLQAINWNVRSKVQTRNSRCLAVCFTFLYFLCFYSITALQHFFLSADNVDGQSVTCGCPANLDGSFSNLDIRSECSNTAVFTSSHHALTRIRPASALYLRILFKCLKS